MYFDAYVIVDWSANQRPKCGKDSIWYCVLERTAGGYTWVIENPGTRVEASQRLAAHLVDLAARGRATFMGFDFAYGYPRGFAAALGLDGWRSTWDFLIAKIKNDDQNRNNRFAVAAQINEQVSGSSYPFWGCPAAATGPCLSPKRETKTIAALPMFRLTEQRQGNPQSVWKLCYPGAVGSQALVGIPVVAMLRNHPILEPISRVWPFETGFGLAPRNERLWTILHAEVYPSLFSYIPELGEVTDRTQVRGLAHRFAIEDQLDTLNRLFRQPDGLTEPELRHVIQEEGWIVGMP